MNAIFHNRSDLCGHMTLKTPGNNCANCGKEIVGPRRFRNKYCGKSCWSAHAGRTLTPSQQRLYDAVIAGRPHKPWREIALGLGFESYYPSASPRGHLGRRNVAPLFSG